MGLKNGILINIQDKMIKLKNPPLGQIFHGTMEEPLMPPPPKKQGGGILNFGRPQQEPVDFSSVTSDVNSMSRRLRLMEQSATNMRRFIQITEENILAKNKHFSAEIKTLASDTAEIRKEIAELKDKLMLIIRELQSVARKDEVKVLEKYINMWNPIRFVSQNEVEQIINEILERKKN